MRLSQPRQAFTLIEVLVVVAIIALLSAVLLPSLQKARAQARGVVCSSGVRQLGVGMTMYLNQFKVYPAHQWIFKASGVEIGRVRWFNAMARQLGGYKVQGCPSTPDWEVGRNNSYGYNYKYIGSARDNAIAPRAPLENFPVKEVKAPARTIAFGDSDGTGWTRPYDAASKEPDRLGNHGYTLDPTFIPTWSLQTYSDGVLEPYAWKQYRTYLAPRHNGRANLVFTDGHAEPMRPELVYVDNRYWNGLGMEDPVRDPHVPERLATGTFRFETVSASAATARQ